jgi:hypothetical protein
MKKKLLFHVCCAPCSGLLSRQLRAEYDVTVYFDNPNIWPEEEFNKRAHEAKEFFAGEGVDFILAKWEHDTWQELVDGLEHEPERGKRCKLCYHYRLENTAKFASQNSFNYFATSLSISPHKEEKVINNLGRALGKKYGVEFLDGNWRADSGYQKSVEFSKEQGFYRQKYCGCEYGSKSGIL